MAGDVESVGEENQIGSKLTLANLRHHRFARFGMLVHEFRDDLTAFEYATGGANLPEVGSQKSFDLRRNSSDAAVE